MDHRFSGFLRRLSIILFWIVLWQTAASLIRNHIFLVGPVDTLRALCEQIVLPDFWSAIAFSFGRISIGFFLAFFLVLFTGSLAYRFPIVDEFLEPPVQLMKTVPVASFVILALIWTGSKNLSVFISFLVVYPMIHVNTKAGLISADRELLEMAEVFHVPFIRRALYIYRTALYPYLKSARQCMPMDRKMGAVWGATSRISPMMVSLVISIIVKYLRC